MEKGISIIIPVYNVEKFLCQCLDSIVNQSYKDTQIILVDDGSNDMSGIICDEYALKYGNVVTVHQNNKGVSAARNKGLEIARKEYICFVDSDDVLPIDAIEKMFCAMLDIDLVIGSIEEINEHGKKNNRMLYLPNKILDVTEFIECLFYEERYGYQGYLWNKLYKRNIIEKNEIRFDEKIKYNEDRLFLTKYCIYCKKIKMIENVAYYYRQRCDSALDITRKGFSATMLTELEAFEKMKMILKNDYPAIFYRIAWLVYEKSLYWIKSVDFESEDWQQYTENILRKNIGVLLKSPTINIYEKMKILGHYLLKR